MAKKSASNTGSIRQKTITRGGKEYTYWEARYTAGTDPGTGKQIQRSITGKTQKEVAQKLKAAVNSIDEGTYSAPNRMNVGDWLDIWQAEYLGGVKPHTVASYSGIIRNHIKPHIGAVKLLNLQPHNVQTLYNALGKPNESGVSLSPKTIKNVHGVLHKALEQAMRNGYIKTNPSDACVLPKIVKKEIKPLDNQDISNFLQAIKGHPLETLFTVVLFTGLREGEAMGLTWDRINFQRGTILVDRQLQQEKKQGGQYYFATLKNDKSRILVPAGFVLDLLMSHKQNQQQITEHYGTTWREDGFVFCKPDGRNYSISYIYKNFKQIAESIGRPDARVHDLRHSYAVAAIRAGDDIKTVQGNLGHATASFTLDVYGHVTEEMRRDSASRMDGFIKSIVDNA